MTNTLCVGVMGKRPWQWREGYMPTHQVVLDGQPLGKDPGWDYHSAENTQVPRSLELASCCLMRGTLEGLCGTPAEKNGQKIFIPKESLLFFFKDISRAERNPHAMNAAPLLLSLLPHELSILLWALPGHTRLCSVLWRPRGLLWVQEATGGSAGTKHPKS